MRGAQGLSRYRAATFTVLGLLFATGLLIRSSPGSVKTVTLELKEVTVSEALTRLFREAQKSFILQPDGWANQKITLSLKDVPFEGALSRVCEAAGLTWTKRDNIYVVQGPTARMTDRLRQDLEKRLFFLEKPRKPTQLQPWLWFSITGKKWLCPSCGELLPHPRMCPKCRRWMSPEWFYCPYDGTALPRPPKKCPKCGADLQAFQFHTAQSIVTPDVRVHVGAYRDEIQIIASARRKMTLRIYDPEDRLAVEKEMGPGSSLHLGLRDLLKKEPEKGTYRLEVVGPDGKVKGSLKIQVRDSAGKNDPEKTTTSI